MPLQKAEAQFDFKPTAPVELELKKGDIVVVRRTSVGEGWWEGEINGKRGLFPSSFVKMLPASAGGSPVPERAHVAPATPVSSKKAFMETMLTPSVNIQEQLYDRERASDLFVRGHSDVSISAGPRWNCFPPTLTIFIKNLHTESRFSGVKHFTVFDVETKQLGTEVTRRYKNFLWFYDKMAELFPCISLPPLPVKQFSGSLLEEHGLEARRRGLETFLNRVASHPVLGSTKLLHDFLTEREPKDWKIGRHISNIKVPKSAKKLFNAPVYSTVKYPPFNVPINQLPSIEKFLKFSRLMEAQIQTMQNSCKLLCLSSGEMMSKVNQLGKDFQRMARGIQPPIAQVRRKVTPTHANNLGVQNGQAHHPGPITRQPSGDVVEEDDTDGEMDDNVQWNWRDDNKFNVFMREIYDVATGMRKLATIQNDHQETVERDVLESLSDYIGIIHTLPTLVKLHEEAMETYNTSKDKDTKKEAEEVRQHCETMNNIVLAEFDHFSDTMVKDFENIILNLLKEQAIYHRHIAKSWDSLYEGYANRRASSLPQTERITSSGKTFSFDKSGSFIGSFASSCESSDESESPAEPLYDPVVHSNSKTPSPYRSDADTTPQPPKPSTSSGIIPTYINIERLDPKSNRDSWEKSGSDQERDDNEHNELYESVIVHEDLQLEPEDSKEESHSYANLEIIQQVPSNTSSAPNSPKKPKKPMPIKRKQGSEASSLTSSLEITNSSESNSSPVLKPKKPQPPAKPKKPVSESKSIDKPNLSVSTPMLNQIVEHTSPDTAMFLAPKLSPPEERRPRNRSKTECEPPQKKRPMLPPMKISRDQAVKKPTPFKMPSTEQPPMPEEKETPQRKTSAQHPRLKPLPSDPGTFRSKVMSMHETTSPGGRDELMRKLSLRRQRLDEQLGAHKVPRHKPNVDKIKEAGSERNSSVSNASSEVVVKYSSPSTPENSNGDGVTLRKHDDSLAKYGIIEDTEGGSFIL